MWASIGCGEGTEGGLVRCERGRLGGGRGGEMGEGEMIDGVGVVVGVNGQSVEVGQLGGGRRLGFGGFGGG